MRKVQIVALVLAVVASFIPGVWAQESFRIGIAQITEHPALDAARAGFIDGMEELGYVAGENVQYDLYSAQGDMSIAQTIAQKLVIDDVDLILAIATPMAQTVANATDSIPILFTAVTDPVVAGLVDSIEEPGGNVTGTSDLTPVAEQLDLLAKLVPKAKRLGIVYNPGEANSVVQVDIAKAKAKELGLTVVEATANNSGAVFQAAQSLIGRVDAIYVPTDNTVASAMESLAVVAKHSKIPVVAGENDMARRGGLATLSIDYYELGLQTAKMAAKILQGHPPHSLPVEYTESESLLINLEMAREIGFTFPQEIMDAADEIVE